MFGFHPALAPVPVQGPPPLSAYPMPAQMQPIPTQTCSRPINAAMAEQMQLQQIMNEMRQLSVSQQAQYLEYVRTTVGAAATPTQHKRAPPMPKVPKLPPIPDCPDTPNLRPCCILGDTIAALSLPDAHSVAPSEHHSVIFDRAEYKQFESLTLGEEKMQTPLQELIACLLSDALDNGDVASKAGETLSSLFEAERLRDADYLAAVHSALSSNVLRRVMSHAQGPTSTKALMTASSDAQKTSVLRTLRDRDTFLAVALSSSGHGYKSIIALLGALTTKKHIALCVESLVANLGALGTDYHGVRLLTRYFEEGAVEGMMSVITAVVDASRMAQLIENKFGWFVYYHLLRCGAPAAITHRIKLGVKGRWAELCCSQYASKVAEECLRHSLNSKEKEDAEWAAMIMRAILEAAETLVADRFGKHVFHEALISQVQAVQGESKAELARVKEQANEVYLRHVEQLRKEKMAKKEKKNELVRSVDA